MKSASYLPYWLLYAMMQCWLLRGTTATSSRRASIWSLAAFSPQRRVDSQLSSRKPLLTRLSSSSSLASSNTTTRRISFLTDVEGDGDYFDRYVDNSKVLQWRTRSASEETDRFRYKRCLEFYNDSDYLVFGGDIWDQGGSDLYVIRQLLDLRARHPTRVHIVLGNRDLNKLRVVCELTSNKKRGVYWLKGSGKIGDPSLASELPFDNSVEHLQWMLESTMGSPRAFAFRKRELQQERGTTKVSDQDVVQSYLSSCDPVHGEMAEFVSHGKLMLRLGEVAFCHGGLPFTSTNLPKDDASSASNLWDDMTFAMPFLPTGTKASNVGVHTIDDWINALNEFAKNRIELWRQYRGQPPVETNGGAWSFRGGYDNHTYPYGSILQYGMGWTPDGIENPTVVYNRWSMSTATQNVRSFYHPQSVFRKHARSFFARAGVRLVCSGHQPIGEIPSAIRVDDDAYVLCADTSYSGDTKRILDDGTVLEGDRGKALSGRGSRAVAEVLIEQEIDTGRVVDCYCHGVLCDGRPYTTMSVFAGNDSGNGLLVGTEASVEVTGPAPHGGAFWTQAQLTDGSKILAAGQGFDLWTRILEGA